MRRVRRLTAIIFSLIFCAIFTHCGLPPSNDRDVRDARADANRDSGVLVEDVQSDQPMFDPSWANEPTIRCDEDASTPPVSPSCGDGGAPATHCRQVHYCGGRFQMGNTATITQSDFPPNGHLQRDCDLHTGVVHSGWVDAYEVTVARCKAWVRAGKPSPRHGEIIFPNFRVENPNAVPTVFPSDAVSNEGIPSLGRQNCTYRLDSNTNDDLPMNCVEPSTALVFCWWDQRHLITEEAWEYLATNRGTTATPVGATPSGERLCEIGDIACFEPIDFGPAGGPTVCPNQALPQSVFARPRDVLMSPPGVFGMFSGLGEFAIATSTWPAFHAARCSGSERAPTAVEGSELRAIARRGGAWVDYPNTLRYWVNPATRIGVGPSIGTGFRCARWENEPR